MVCRAGPGVVNFWVACPMVSKKEQTVEMEQATESHRMQDSLQVQRQDTMVKWDVVEAEIGHTWGFGRGARQVNVSER
jgi:hypothetical protein